MDSQAILDACAFPRVLLADRLLLRLSSASASTRSSSASPAAETWQQVYAVLTPRSLLWLCPPHVDWRRLSLENAFAEIDKRLPEAFEVGTARQSFQFRCRSAAAAARWVEVLADTAEQATGNGLLESAETVMGDRLEATYQTQAIALIASAPQDSMDRLRKRTADAEAERRRLAAKTEPELSKPLIAGSSGAASGSASLSAAEANEEAQAVGFTRLIERYGRPSRGTLSITASTSLPRVAHVNAALTAVLATAAAAAAGGPAGLAAAPGSASAGRNGSLSLAAAAGSRALPPSVVGIGPVTASTVDSFAPGRIAGLPAASAVPRGLAVSFSLGRGGAPTAATAPAAPVSLSGHAMLLARQAAVAAAAAHPTLVESAILAGASVLDILRGYAHLRRRSVEQAADAAHIVTMLRRVQEEAVARRRAARRSARAMALAGGAVSAPGRLPRSGVAAASFMRAAASSGGAAANGAPGSALTNASAAAAAATGSVPAARKHSGASVQSATGGNTHAANTSAPSGSAPSSSSSSAYSPQRRYGQGAFASGSGSAAAGGYSGSGSRGGSRLARTSFSAAPAAPAAAPTASASVGAASVQTAAGKVSAGSGPTLYGGHITGAAAAASGAAAIAEAIAVAEAAADAAAVQEAGVLVASMSSFVTQASAAGSVGDDQTYAGQSQAPRRAEGARAWTAAGAAPRPECDTDDGPTPVRLSAFLGVPSPGTGSRDAAAVDDVDGRGGIDDVAADRRLQHQRQAGQGSRSRRDSAGSLGSDVVVLSRSGLPGMSASASASAPAGANEGADDGASSSLSGLRRASDSGSGRETASLSWLGRAGGNGPDSSLESPRLAAAVRALPRVGDLIGRDLHHDNTNGAGDGRGTAAALEAEGMSSSGGGEAYGQAQTGRGELNASCGSDIHLALRSLSANTDGVSDEARSTSRGASGVGSSAAGALGDSSGSSPFVLVRAGSADDSSNTSTRHDAAGHTSSDRGELAGEGDSPRARRPLVMLPRPPELAATLSEDADADSPAGSSNVI